MLIFEALCESCGETFNPAPSFRKADLPIIQDSDGPIEWMGDYGFTKADLEHGQRTDGTDCGAPGELKGGWRD